MASKEGMSTPSRPNTNRTTPAPPPSLQHPLASAHFCLKCQPVRLSGCQGFQNAHALRRIYIGPSPVLSARAISAARELAEDQLKPSGSTDDGDSSATASQDPRSLQKAKSTGDILVEKLPWAKEDQHVDVPPTESEQPASQQRPDPIQFRWKDLFAPPPALSSSADAIYTSAAQQSAPRSASSDASFAQLRPRTFHRDRSNASFASGVSFVSARSMPRSVFSEGDATERRSDGEDDTVDGHGDDDRDGPSAPWHSRTLVTPQSSTKRQRRTFRKEHSAAGSLGVGWKPAPLETARAAPGTEGCSPSSASLGILHTQHVTPNTLIGDPGIDELGSGEVRQSRSAEPSARSSHLRSASAEDRARARLDASLGNGHAGGIPAGRYVWDTSYGRAKPLPLLDLPVREADESAPSPHDEVPPPMLETASTPLQAPLELQPKQGGASGTPSHDSTYLAPASASTKRLSFDSSVNSLSRSMTSSLGFSEADGAEQRGKRRALSPSLFDPSPSSGAANGRAAGLETNGESAYRLRPLSLMSTRLGSGKGQRPTSAISWTSASPESTIHRAAGGKMVESALSSAFRPEAQGSGAADHGSATDGFSRPQLGSAEVGDDTAAADPDPAARQSEADGSHVLGTETPWYSQRGVGKGFPSSPARIAASAQDQRNHLSFPGSAAKNGVTSRLSVHGPSAHPRDYSRQSRMSRASTVGTFNTMGTNATDGSFGIGGSVRDRLAKALFANNSYRRPTLARTGFLGHAKHSRGPLKSGRTRIDSRSSRATVDGEPSDHATNRPLYAKRYVHRREENASFLSTERLRGTRRRNLSGDSQMASFHDRHSRASSLGGAPVGAVGTSGGGTKWVGQSFEVGGRLSEVMESRKAKIAEREPCEHLTSAKHAAASDGSKGILRKQSQEAKVPPTILEPVAVEEGPPDKPKDRSDSPSAVLSLMAGEARDATRKRAKEEEQEKGSEDAAKPPQAPVQAPDVGAEAGSGDIDCPSVASAAGGPQWTSIDTTVVATPRTVLRGPSSVDIDEARASITSLSQIGGLTGDGLDIESRLGWKDVASAITANSARLVVPSSVAKSPSDCSQTATVAEGLAPPQVRRRTSSLKADTVSQQASHYSDAVMNPPGGQGGRRMTRREAMAHPDPPTEAEDRFPELTHALLRRQSDDALRTSVELDAASDHIVATQAVASPEELPPNEHEAPLEAAVRQAPGLGSPSILQAHPSPNSSRARQVSAQTSSIGAALSHRSASPSSTHQLLAPQRTSSQRPQPSTSSAAPEAPRKLDSSAPRKKMVQFDQRPSLKRSLTASLFAPKASGNPAMELNALGRPQATSGDSQPVPPEQVLARPIPDTPSPSAERPGRSPKAVDTVHFDGLEDVVSRKTVLKKDRMLVKLAWTAHEDLPKDFDELTARKFAIRDEEWREYVVVYRMGKLELWGDSTFTNKVLGHGDRLKLRHTISLSRGSTFLSVYSPIDRIFCLTHQYWKATVPHHHRSRLHLRRHGTDIALFDCRAQTVAADWIWELWRELGGRIPQTLEVQLASLGVKVRVPIPDELTAEQVRYALAASGRSSAGGKARLADESLRVGGEGFSIITKDNIIAMLWKLACNLPDWRELMDYGQQHGLRLELAWRRGNVLDWIMHERTVDGQARPWAILAGGILKEYRTPTTLELRPGVHYPTTVRLATGQQMAEPPAIEGFLWRVKPVSGSLTRLYLSTHDGHLFICKPSRAFPPDRHLYSQLQNALKREVPSTTQLQSRKTNQAAPGHNGVAYKALSRFLGRTKTARREESVGALRQQVLNALSYPAETEEDLQAQIEAYRAFEKRRQFEQICGSDGYVDLRSVWMIRAMGNGPVRYPGEDDVRPSGPRGGAAALRRVYADQEVVPHNGEESDDNGDDDDIGGEEGLAAAADRAELRRARQIEIILTNGRTIRVEAYSRSVAREWIERISELVKYWRRREKADALDMMTASGFDVAATNKRLQDRRFEHDHYSRIPDEKLSPVLSNIWHWCAIEGCRGIIKCGRLFHKLSSYAPFQSRYYLLIAGRLLCFKLVKSQRTARSRQNAGIFHRRQERVIHLRDAYVYSGKLSDDLLANGRSQPAQAIGGIDGGGSNSGHRHRFPRVYRDGLFSFDDDEDCTLVIRYRPERVNLPTNPPSPNFSMSAPVAAAAAAASSRTAPQSVPGQSPTATATAATIATGETVAQNQPQPQPQQQQAGPSGSGGGGGGAAAAALIPKLEDKMHKYIALRARNKLERDQWVRCIAYAIEKIVRDDGEREEKMKNTGKVDF